MRKLFNDRCGIFVYMRGPVFLIILVACHFGVLAQPRWEGVFTGLERIDETEAAYNTCSSAVKKNQQWYHLSYLMFSGDSVILEQIPVTVHGNDTIFGPDDEGQKIYTGRKNPAIKGDSLTVSLYPCKKCAMRMINFVAPSSGSMASVESGVDTDSSAKEKKTDKVVKRVKIKRTGDGNIIVNGERFRPLQK